MKKGFSLTELLVVVALTMIIGLIIFSNFYTRKNISDLNSATNQIVSILNEARNRAIAQDKDSSWGVRFENSTSASPYYALFYSDYSTSTLMKKYNLPNFVKYNTSTIPLGGYLNVVFKKISGELNSSTSINIYLNLIRSDIIIATSSININLVGRINY